MTPNASSSSSRANNQHNRPSQISFTGFGNDEKYVPNDTRLLHSDKNYSSRQQQQQRNEAYFGTPTPAAAGANENSFYDFHNQQQQQNQENMNRNDQHDANTTGTTSYQQHQHELHQQQDADTKLQKCFQNDLLAAKPLFSARQISTRHLKSGFQLFGSPEDSAILYTDRMLQQRQKIPLTTTAARSLSAGASSRGFSAASTTRNTSVMLPTSSSVPSFHSPSITAVPEETASPVVVDYHDDVGHGKRTLRAVQLGRKQEFRDDAKAFVERNGISILGRMEAEQAAGTAKNTSLPGVQNRKNRSATPSSSETHLRGVGMVTDSKADGSQFRFGRKVHPHQLHKTNLTASLLPVRRIMTPSCEILASPPRAHGGKTARVGPRYAVDTNRVVCPDMIPIAKAPRLRSLAPPEMLGQGMEIKDGAPQWTWKGGLKGDYWKHNQPTDPFGGDV